MHSRNYLQFLNHLEISSAPKDDALSRPLHPLTLFLPPSSNAPFLLLCTATPIPTSAWSGLLLIGNVLSEHHAPQAPHPSPPSLEHTLPSGLICAAPCRLAGCMADYWLKMLWHLHCNRILRQNKTKHRSGSAKMRGGSYAEERSKK